MIIEELNSNGRNYRIYLGAYGRFVVRYFARIYLGGEEIGWAGNLIAAHVLITNHSGSSTHKSGWTTKW
jgi:hypothetical protein